MVETMIERIRQHMAAGVVIPHPETITIGDEVEPGSIAAGVIIHPCCRISGASTRIAPHCIIGEETPATLHESQLACGVQIKGGYIAGTTCLDGVSIGSAAHIRPGCLLEEYSSCAHAVGLKQTLLMPYTALGSLINFCDCMMSGGTGPDNHSEVGSSYIHFNFTPHQDKATPSLIGDVPHGVLLHQPPVFLGGQGGLVGPCRIAFGTTIAAGTICRHDVMIPGMLISGSNSNQLTQRKYNPEHYGSIERIVRHNLYYIASLHALAAWYSHVRLIWADGNPWQMAVQTAGRQQIDAMVTERIRQMDRFSSGLKNSLTANSPSQHTSFVKQWPALSQRLKTDDTPLPGQTTTILQTVAGGLSPERPFPEQIQMLDAESRAGVTRELTDLIETRMQAWEKDLL